MTQARSPGAVGRIGVVVPAHDEQELLPACLEALLVAASDVTVPVEALVVLDACTDASAAVVAAAIPRARSAGVVLRAVDVAARNVGLARGAGLDDLARRGPPATTWLATTDADSIVPPHWLTRQLQLADAGTDAVLGTIEVADWLDHPPATQRAFLRAYRPVDDHPHVHGANLGVRASAYLAAGGVPSLALAEDHALVAALVGRGARIARVGGLAVVTSARRDPRAAGGFGDHLGALPA